MANGLCSRRRVDTFTHTWVGHRAASLVASHPDPNPNPKSIRSHRTDHRVASQTTPSACVDMAWHLVSSPVMTCIAAASDAIGALLDPSTNPNPCTCPFASRGRAHDPATGGQSCKPDRVQVRGSVSGGVAEASEDTVLSYPTSGWNRS